MRVFVIVYSTFCV